MTLGIIARADASGLGTQCLEIARHTNPASILIVHQTADHRGPCHPEWYADTGAEVVVRYLERGEKLSDVVVKNWLKDLSCVYTAESDYGANLALWAAKRGVHLVVHANPELWNERYRDATTRVVTPTDWEAERIPASRVVPMPVDRERLPWCQRTKAERFWFPSAPAFHDRHGAAVVLKALRYIAAPIELVISGEADETRWHQANSGAAKLTFLGPRANYWDGYREADVLVLPRRYGGLSLPVQEALSSGMPVVMADTGPYAGHPGVLTIPAVNPKQVHMKGGIFSVWDCDPRNLADEIDELAYSAQLVQNASRAANTTAETLDWQQWRETWTGLLR